MLESNYFSAIVNAKTATVLSIAIAASISILHIWEPMHVYVVGASTTVASKKKQSDADTQETDDLIRHSLEVWKRDIIESFIVIAFRERSINYHQGVGADSYHDNILNARSMIEDILNRVRYGHEITINEEDIMTCIDRLLFSGRLFKRRQSDGDIYFRPLNWLLYYDELQSSDVWRASLKELLPAIRYNGFGIKSENLSISFLHSLFLNNGDIKTLFKRDDDVSCLTYPRKSRIQIPKHEEFRNHCKLIAETLPLELIRNLVQMFHTTTVLCSLDPLVEPGLYDVIAADVNNCESLSFAKKNSAAEQSLFDLLSTFGQSPMNILTDNELSTEFDFDMESDLLNSVWYSSFRLSRSRLLRLNVLSDLFSDLPLDVGHVLIQLAESRNNYDQSFFSDDICLEDSVVGPLETVRETAGILDREAAFLNGEHHHQSPVLKEQLVGANRENFSAFASATHTPNSSFDSLASPGTMTNISSFQLPRYSSVLSETTDEELLERVYAFYDIYSPFKKEAVPNLLQKYKNQKDKLIHHLHFKYRHAIAVRPDRGAVVNVSFCDFFTTLISILVVSDDRYDCEQNDFAWVSKDSETFPSSSLSLYTTAGIYLSIIINRLWTWSKLNKSSAPTYSERMTAKGPETPDISNCQEDVWTKDLRNITFDFLKNYLVDNMYCEIVHEDDVFG